MARILDHGIDAVQLNDNEKQYMLDEGFDEIKAVKKWVNDGGSLFLIADHMPCAGAAKDLAAEFGFEFTNGFVLYESSKNTSPPTIGIPNEFP